MYIKLLPSLNLTPNINFRNNNSHTFLSFSFSLSSYLPILIIVLCLVNQSVQWCQSTKWTDTSPILCAQYSPDGTTIATTTSVSFTLWSRVTKQILYRKSLSNGGCARYSRDLPTSFIAISKTSMSIQIINANYPYNTICNIGNAGNGGSGAAVIDWTQNNQLITCGGTNNKVNIWTINAGTATANNIYSYSINNNYCSYYSNNKIAITLSNKLQLYTLTAPSTTTVLTSKSINNCIKIIYDNTGSNLYASCGSGATSNGIIISMSTYTVTNIITTGNMKAVGYTNYGPYYAYGGDTNMLFIINGTSNNNSIVSQFVYGTAHVSQIDFSYDGSYLLVGTDDGMLYQYSKNCLSTYCIPGYYANSTSNKCIQCQITLKGCSYCLNSSQCLQCYQNYYINTVTHLCQLCSVLITNCVSCFNSTLCRYCTPGYYLLANNTCANCQQSLVHCYLCNTSNICTQCQSDYYLDTTTNTCIDCYIANNKCIKCVNSTYCTYCVIGYYQSSGNCLKCSTNCYICQSGTNCTDCLPGYYPVSSGGSITCNRCNAGCLVCNRTGYCLICNDQRYIDSSGNCITCPYGCTSCNNNTYCYSCIAHYYINNITGSCVQCALPCDSCNTSSICLSCVNGYYMNNINSTCQVCQYLIPYCMLCTQTICLQCNNQYYLYNSTYCQSCQLAMKGCVQCISSTVCKLCVTNYYLQTSNSTCIRCNSSCVTCININNCTTCDIGYYIDTTTSTCNRCPPGCIVCNNSTYCLQCTLNYRVNILTGTCIKCSTDIAHCITCYYNITLSLIQCLQCQTNMYYNNTSNTCQYCAANCTSCVNSTYCNNCQIGMYINSNNNSNSSINGVCMLCHQNCTACSANYDNCSACTIGYYLVGNTCKYCQDIGCATCNSTTLDCLSCPIGFYLTTASVTNLTKICTNCLLSISNCYVCSSASICTQCSYGYALYNNTCTACSIIQGCKHCSTLLICQNCQIGYYLQVYNSSSSVCVQCSIGCKECSNVTCSTCNPIYYLNSTTYTCQLCQSILNGCYTCVSSTSCISCLPTYYISNITCALCSSSIFACRYCNTSSICTYCQDGYYLFNNTCIKCSTAIDGCLLCNSSTICLYCDYGMYLYSNTTNSSSMCYTCSNNIPYCLYCSNYNTCLQCDSGTFLYTNNTNASNIITVCLQCNAYMIGCILCSSSTACLQCISGYYLNTSNNKCTACSIQGCQICQYNISNSSSICIKCSNQYYMNSTINKCILCSNNIIGCISCNNSNICYDCNIGYYLNYTTNLCQLCSNNILGCGVCYNNTQCIQCKTGYYLQHNTTINKSICKQCKLSIIGCQSCTNNNTCQQCYHNYYLQLSTHTCIQCNNIIIGCISCISSTQCLYCANTYFYEPLDKLCYSCQILYGCYSCTNNITCNICKGGYILNDDMLCQDMKVQAYQTVTAIKLVTKYIDDNILIHYLYAKNMRYNVTDGINWNATTKLYLQDYQYRKIQLVINYMEWINQYTIAFYTNNPLKLNNNNFGFFRLLQQQQLQKQHSHQYTSHIQQSKQSKYDNNNNIRLLAKGGSIQQQYTVNIKMQQSTINKILPQFYFPRDLLLGYDLSSSQFVQSYSVTNPTLYIYSLFGYAILGIFLLFYIVKACITVPLSAQMGDIIPDIAAYKVPALIVYPVHYQFVYFCSGFMLSDFPWLNSYFGNLFSYAYDTSAKPYAMFYTNMNIGSTYLLAICTAVVISFVLWMIYRSKYKKLQQLQQQQQQHNQTNKTKSKSKPLSIFPIGTVFYNFYLFGAVFAGMASFQGALLNPIQQININVTMYMFGILLYFFIFAYIFYCVFRDRRNMYMIRIFIKASLFALANLSAIYLFSAAILIDIGLLIVQLYLSNVIWMYPKIWFIKHFLSDIGIIVLTLLPDIMISLIIAGAMIGIVLILDLYTHYKQFSSQFRNKKLQHYDVTEAKQKIIQNNIWNIGSQNQYAIEKQVYVQPQKIQNPLDLENMQQAARQTKFVKTSSSFGKTNFRQLRNKKQRLQKPDMLIFNDVEQQKVKHKKQIQQIEGQNTFLSKQVINEKNDKKRRKQQKTTFVAKQLFQSPAQKINEDNISEKHNNEKTNQKQKKQQTNLHNQSTHKLKNDDQFIFDVKDYIK